MTLAVLSGGGTLLLTTTPVTAQSVAITGYSFSRPSAIVSQLVSGPDGALWLTWATPQPATGLTRMTVAGGATTVPIPSPWGTPYSVGALTSAAGSLWVSETHDSHSYIGRWSPAGSLVAEYQVPTYAYAITFGPDGNIWFSGGDPTTLSGGYIGRMTLAGAITTFAMPDPTHMVAAMTAGPDGAVWFTEAPGRNVGRVSPAGTFTEFAVPGASDIAAAGEWTGDLTFGSDGALWLVVPLLGDVERMTTAGAFTHFAIQPSGSNDQALSITSGPDGNLWVTVPMYTDTESLPFVVKLTPAGGVTSYPIATSISRGRPTVITSGPDGALWFGEQDSVVARLDPAIPPETGAPTTVQPPVPATGTGATAGLWSAALLLAGIAMLLGPAPRRKPAPGDPPAQGQILPRLRPRLRLRSRSSSAGRAMP